MKISFVFAKWQRAEDCFNEKIENLEAAGNLIKNISLAMGENDIVYAVISYEENKKSQ